MWETAGAKIADEATRILAGVKDEDPIAPEELGERASRALKEHRYAHTIIRAGAGRVVVRTLTVNGQWREYESTAKTFERDFEARGLSRYMMRQNIRPQAVIEDIGTHLGHQEMVEVRQIKTTHAGEAHRLAAEQAPQTKPALRNRRMQVRARPGRSVASVFGMLARPGTPRRSIEELNEAAAGGWAGEA